MIKSPRKNVADPAGVEPQPPDHQSDAHPTEPPRPTNPSKLNCLNWANSADDN